jgi:hypothetical protein
MKSMISSSVRNTRALPRSPVLKALLRKGVSTKELDATKGGEFVSFATVYFHADTLQIVNGWLF